jgi:hypothetical protein
MTAAGPLVHAEHSTDSKPRHQEGGPLVGATPQRSEGPCPEALRNTLPPAPTT